MFLKKEIKMIHSENFPKCVLIVDDDEHSQEILRKAFSGWGVTDILLAGNGLKAVHVLDSMLPHPDVLVCDIFMPDMDGIEFIDELVKRNFKGGVIFVTGVNREMLDVAQTIASHRGLRVLAEFVKPIQPDVLLKVLK
jgi:CheY-like chemotaxis protein